MTTVTRFELDDFPELTEEERQLLATDEHARQKLADRFLDSLGDWNFSAECAVDAWREGGRGQPA